MESAIRRGLRAMHRTTAPLEAALDEMIDYIAALQPRPRAVRTR
jgi:hypothetical protein